MNNFCNFLMPSCFGIVTNNIYILAYKWKYSLVELFIEAFLYLILNMFRMMWEELARQSSLTNI